jgi:8-oxo-dGTP diphosphatase
MRIISVVGAVIHRDGKILAAQRKKGSRLGGLWEFPGGKIELNESPKEALMREIQEELEAEIEIGDQICTVTHQYDFATIQLTTFSCMLSSDSLVLNDHDETRWLFPSELDTINWAPADIPTIEFLKNEASQ